MKIEYLIIIVFVVFFYFLIKYGSKVRKLNNIVYVFLQEFYIDVPVLSQVLFIHNAERLLKGLKPLKADSNLTLLAKDRVWEMIQLRKLTHEEGKDERAKLIELGADAVGENIAIGYTSAETLMKAFMKSDGHRKNILSKSFDYIGIAHDVDDLGTHWWCVLFVDEKSVN